MFSKNLALKSCAALGATIAFASALFCGNANATTAGFSLVGGQSYVLPTGTGVNGFDPGSWDSSNNFGINGGTTVYVFSSFLAGQGLFVSDGTLNSSETVTLRFTYEGFEAGYTNVSESAFVYGDNALFVNRGPTTIGSNTYSAAVPGTSQVTETFGLTSNPALVPFLFKSITGNTIAVNGGTVTDSSTPTAIAFLLVNDNQTAYAFFDDSGAGPDKDFDDMVVRIDLLLSPPVTNVPLPAALPLFASGLGAMGMVAWRRRRKR